MSYHQTQKSQHGNVRMVMSTTVHSSADSEVVVATDLRLQRQVVLKQVKSSKVVTMEEFMNSIENI